LDELISEGAIDLMKTIFLSNFRLSVKFDKESKRILSMLRDGRPKGEG
jgi:hypothetical protein